MTNEGENHQQIGPLLLGLGLSPLFVEREVRAILAPHRPFLGWWPPIQLTTHTDTQLTTHTDTQLTTHSDTDIMPQDCRFGKGCTRYGCTFKHPTGRWGDCREGTSCTRRDCRFQHPRAGGGAMVQFGGGTTVHRRVIVQDADGRASVEIEQRTRVLVRRSSGGRHLRALGNG